MLIDTILEKAPTLRRLLEEKIASELAAKQEEIDRLKEELTFTQLAVAEIAERLVGGAE